MTGQLFPASRDAARFRRRGRQAALMPLVADLAPPSLRGRYMASMGLSWRAGLALAQQSARSF